MKKYLKLQAKKALSLMLAVLMLMSCWVWVAPEKAEAAGTAADGWYFVALRADVQDWSNLSGVTQKATCYYKENNGRGSDEKSVALTVNTAALKDTSFPKNAIIASAWVQGFPTKINYEWTSTKNGDAYRIEYMSVYVSSGENVLGLKAGARTDGCTVGPGSDTCGATDASGSFDTVVGENVEAGFDPDPAVQKFPAVTASKTVAIPALGSGGTSYSDSFEVKPVDQYGVSWIAGNVSYFVSDATGNEAEYEGAKVVADGTKKRLEVTEKLQTSLTTTDGTENIYITASLEDSMVTQTIPLSYTPLKITVDANDSAAEITTNKGIQTGKAEATAYYAGTASEYPTGGRDEDGNFIGAKRAGYTFKGFWSNQQPATGDASVDTNEATFANPVSTTEFEAMKSQEGAKVAGDIVTTADGKKYYNAGKEYDASEASNVTENKTYYAWWISKEISIKFYDIDGKFLGEKTTKYNTKPAATWYDDVAPKGAGYSVGAYKYGVFTEKWRDITGAIVEEGNYTFGPTDNIDTFILTPVFTKEYKDTYSVQFINPVVGGQNGGGTYLYRQDITAPTFSMPTALSNHKGYSYEFIGWTTQVPEGARYHTVHGNDATVTPAADLIVRGDADYYAIYKGTLKSYSVDFKYYDSMGTLVTKRETFTYGSAITTPSYVNRSYANAAGLNKNLLSWSYTDKDKATASFDAGEIISLTEDKVDMQAWHLAGSSQKMAITFTAVYDAGTYLPYNVTFKYKNAIGVELTKYIEVENGTKIPADRIEALAVPTQYDNGDFVYNFSGTWKVTEGKADKEIYTTAELASFKPTSHVTFEAVYGEGIPYYTVTYIHGSANYSEKVLEGSNIPAWMIKDAEGKNVEYVPADYNGDGGVFEFAGWFDEAQTDKELKETNGTKYEKGDKVQGDLKLYAQFKFNPTKYTIKFMNYNGTIELASTQVEKGQSFKDTFDLAESKTDRAPDEYYHYTFIGWDFKVPDNFLCEGKDVTYTAQYKAGYIDYVARWYNDKASMLAADFEFETVGHDGLLAKTKHIYESALFAPSVTFTYPDASELKEGESWVFAGWKYIDKNGEEADYVRGMEITDAMSFYATYTAKKNTVTLTTVIDGTVTDIKVEYGDKASEYVGKPADGYKDATYHTTFKAWYTDAAYENEFNINSEIEGNTTIYAKFETAAHEKTLSEVTKNPSYYTLGTQVVWCNCNKEETAETSDIPMLTDTVKPTGTIYLGDRKWSSTDEVGAAASDNDPIDIFVNADTNVILTVNDTGDVHPAHNPTGYGKGISIIRAFVFNADEVFTADSYTNAQKVATTIYPTTGDADTTENLNNTANYVTKVKDLKTAEIAADGTVVPKDLVDGESYIIYYYVKDKAGNVLNTKVRTAKFTYDETAPEFTIAGDSNADKGVSTVTYCDKAVIKGIENDATVIVNDEEVKLTTAGLSGATAYTIKEAGNYLVKVIDKAGNVASRKIVVADGHNEAVVEIPATCTADGSKTVTCAICDKVLSEEVLKSDGHAWSEAKVVAPTCDKEGYTTKTCSVCELEEKTDVQAALGHALPKDADGNTVYEVVKKATCSSKGEKAAVCTRCNKYRETVEIDIDPTAHVYGGIKTKKPTCVDAGWHFQICKYCGVEQIIDENPETPEVDLIPATGHTEATKITLEPTCTTEGVKTVYCKSCGVDIRTEAIAVIPHTLELVEYKNVDTFTEEDKVAYPNGYMQYECKYCDYAENKTAIKEKASYTLTFKGAGANGADLVITKKEGESIAADDVPELTKNADNVYTYTFAGWKGTDNKLAKFPITVTKNETYTAEFTSSTNIYTHIFKVPTKWVGTLSTEDAGYVEYATIIGKYEDKNKAPVSVPTFTDADKSTDAELKRLYTFTFSHWATSNGEKVEDFTMYGDKEFYAVFTNTPIKYSVIFYSGNSFVASKEVDGGDTVELIATDDALAAKITKAYTADKHYSFNGKWYTDADCKNEFSATTAITAKTTLYAGFDEEEHGWVKDAESAENKAATCYEDAKVAYKCDCGATKVETVEDTKLDHIMGEYVYNEETGYKVSSCTRNCGFTHKIKASVTVTFLNENGVALYTDTVQANGQIKYEGAEPTKASTAQYSYTFAGWVDKEDATKKYAKDHVFANLEEDATYIAYYTSTVRTYRVSYLDINGKVIETKEGIAYGAAVPAFTGVAPTKAYDDTYHYVFAGWNVAADATVTGDLPIKPVFTAVKHEYDEGTVTNATCEKDGGLTKKCVVCGQSYISKDIVPATGHKYDYNNPQVTEPNYVTGENGERRFYCKNGCGKYESEVIYAYIDLVINVKDANGNPRQGVKVALVYANDVTKPVEGTRTLESNADGIVTFRVKPGDYKALIDTDYIEISVSDKNGSASADFKQEVAEPEPEDTSCRCSCHKNNIWGTIFRFFHKIIKMITGKVRCCTNPDSRYF